MKIYARLKIFSPTVLLKSHILKLGLFHLNGSSKGAKGDRILFLAQAPFSRGSPLRVALREQGLEQEQGLAELES
jgi:hypothetical protein